MKQIPLFKPSCSKLEIESVNKVLKSGWWTMGEVVKKLEEEFASFVGMKYAVALNSATSALHLAVHVLKERSRIKDGNIIVPSLTFVSTGMVGLYEKLDVRFSDIDGSSLCMSEEDTKKMIDEKTIAVIPVHYGGRLAKTNYDIPVIEDCAHLGGYRGPFNSIMQIQSLIQT